MKPGTKIVLVLALALLTALAFAVPKYIRAHTWVASNACVNNLRQIDGAKQQWALENSRTNGLVTIEAIVPYLGRGSAGEMPTCPQGGTYSIGKIGERPKCSIAAHALP